MVKRSDGFTLIEVIVVIAILGILVAVAVPRLVGFRNKVEENICDINRETVEKMYSTFLVEKDIYHEDSIFNQFVIQNFDKICPAGGVISYEDGKIKCSVHGSVSEGKEEEGPGEEVPWL